jgi:putative phosphoesterase
MSLAKGLKQEPAPQSKPSQGLVTLGLIADTHIPDRSRGLHLLVLPTFEHAGVTTILHAGDICVPAVLRELEQVAPVLAVRGNRDWFVSRDLPMQRRITMDGVQIGMTHGHASWAHYVRDKLRFLIFGPQSFEHFMNRAVSLLPGADVVVFGHNHEPMVKVLGETLVVNPGSACCQALPGRRPTIALLHLEARKARAEIIELAG